MPGKGPGPTRREQSASSPIRAPVILAKGDKASANDSRGSSASSGRLWKPDSDVRLAVSPKSHGIPSALQSGDLPGSRPSYKIQQRSELKPATATAANDWTKVSLPAEPASIIDDCMYWSSDAIAEFLLEQTEYRVIGVLGGEGVGKTRVLSLFASHPAEDESPFSFSDGRPPADGIGHMTSGVNMYITNERTILLDCQPLFSSSVFSNVIGNERKYNTSYHLAEEVFYSMDLELVMFMLAVCHIVIVVENWFTDTNLHRTLQTVEMLKPPQLSSEKPDDHNDFTSKIVFVQNMCESASLTTATMHNIESTLSRIYTKSSLNILRNPNGEVKVFYLPQELDDGDQDLASIITGRKLKLVQDIMTTPVTPILSHTQLSEKHWLQYAARMWEAVKKSSFLSEYMRLLV